MLKNNIFVCQQQQQQQQQHFHQNDIRENATSDGYSSI